MQLPAAASIEQAGEMLVLLERAFEQGSGPLAIDAGALRNFDTSTLALLLEAQRRARATGRDFSISGAPAKLIELARLYGVEELLPLSSASPAATPGAAA